MLSICCLQARGAAGSTSVVAPASSPARASRAAGPSTSRLKKMRRPEGAVISALTLAKRLHPTTLAPGAYARESVFDVADRWPAAAVVSAASLLAVLPDRALALDALCRALQPSGTLLLIEPSQTMGPEAAAAYRASHPQEPKAWVLQLWARTRLQERAVQSKDLIHPELELSCHPLLGGMVNAWVLSKRPVSN